jgi:hypothetical protein
MTKMKDFESEIRQEFMQSDAKYCVYCTEPKDGKTTCCSEYHFVPFSSLYPQDQAILIQEQLDEYNKWSATQ